MNQNTLTFSMLFCSLYGCLNEDFDYVTYVAELQTDTCKKTLEMNRLALLQLKCSLLFTEFMLFENQLRMFYFSENFWKIHKNAL